MKVRSRSRRRGVSRREFLAGTAAAGLAVGAPSLLGACGGDNDRPPRVSLGTREARTLHFDFSFAEVEDVTLMAIRSPHHRASISAHTEESRGDFRAANPMLMNVPDERLTHFVEAIDLPADNFQMLWMTGTHSGTGESALLGFHLHIPTPFLQARTERLLRAGRRRLPSAKMQAYGIGAGNGQLDDFYNDVNDFHTPFDVAVALVFHHPEIMNLDPVNGTDIYDLIQTLPCAANDSTCTPFIGTLAFHVATHWPATTSGGWATLVQLTDVDGNPSFDEQGKPRYRYDIADDTLAAAAQTVREILKSIFNDEQYQGSNWHATQGQTIAVPSGGSAQRVAGQQSGLDLTAEHGVGTSVNGVDFVGIAVTDQANRTVEVQLKNHYLRYLTAFVQFANEVGDLPITKTNALDTDRANFAKFVFTNDTLLGIPFTGALVETQSFNFNVPSNATKARVYFGSLGLGGQAFCPEALPGSIATIAINIGIPALLLAVGVAASSSTLLKEGITNLLLGNTTVENIIKAAKLLLVTTTPNLVNGIFGTAASGDAGPILISLGNAVLQAVLTEADDLALALAAIIGSMELADAIPIIGVVVRLLSIAADLAAIGQTVGEVLTNPALFTNLLSVTMTTTVTINRDPNDFQFPARARKYSVTLTYDKASSQAHKMSGAIEPGRVDPIMVVFDGVPSGGMVQVSVIITSEDDFVVGTGSAGPLAALPATASIIPVTIAEVLIPLTQATQYEHVLKLEYQNGQRTWVETTAPTATRTSLCAGQDNALCALNGITVHTRTGMTGYGYQAGGQAVSYCSEPGGGIMHLIQNVFLGQNPQAAFKGLPCGFHQPVGIVYDPTGPSSGVGRHFFLQPGTDAVYLQSLTLDNTTPINVLNPLSWGRFSQPQDSVAVHPAGYVVGVNRLTHKMEILQLPSQPGNAQSSPQAVPFTWMKSGEGDRAGLMRVPVSVVVSDNAILVLEDGNARIQAFDVNANPVLRFRNQTTSIVELRDRGPGVVYLDLGVEGLGYLYVLSFVNDGLMPNDYRLDVYDPQGNFLARTTGVAAARMAVDVFRNVYTLNFETLAGAPNIEPSLSQWQPSTPGE